MLAIKRVNSERVFVPIIPLRNENRSRFEKENMITKMAAKNPELLKLISGFDLK